jgi:ribosome-binding protein aMBF1 (putative translation factor)
MNLNQLKEILSKDPSYRRQYNELDGVVELAMQVRAAREAREITQEELAKQTGYTTFCISRFETLAGIPEPDLISAVVDYLEVPLREANVRVEDWIIARSGEDNRRSGNRSSRPPPSPGPARKKSTETDRSKGEVPK